MSQQRLLIGTCWTYFDHRRLQWEEVTGGSARPEGAQLGGTASELNTDTRHRYKQHLQQLPIFHKIHLLRNTWTLYSHYSKIHIDLCCTLDLYEAIMKQGNTFNVWPDCFTPAQWHLRLYTSVLFLICDCKSLLIHNVLFLHNKTNGHKTRGCLKRLIPR